jgi:pimeloyl-ACP methyl ester carboxylesterase
MMTVRSKDGTSIAFDRSGSGPALILVAGALCYRGFGPTPSIAKLLAARFSVFDYDRRGRGQSSDTGPYAVEREIEDIDALIQEAGGSAYLAGLSSGAALALEAAARLNGVKRVAMYEAPFFFDDAHPPRPDNYVAQMADLISAGRRSDALKLFMTTVGTPAIAVQVMRITPIWPKMKRVAHTPALRPEHSGGHSGGQATVARAVGVRANTRADSGRREKSGVVAKGNEGAFRGTSQRTPCHFAGPDAHGEGVPAGAGSDGVLSELKRARS